MGAAVSGLAARVAGERYLGLKFDRLEHATDLKDALGGLKGPLMKVAQILSTIPNALPNEYAAQLAELATDQVEGIFWRNAATALGIGEEERAANE